MQLNRTKNELDREARNNENQNWEKIEKIADDISGKAFEQLVDKAKLIWKEPVNTFEDLPSNAEIGETRQIRSTGKVYRWDGTDWNEIQQIDAGPVNEVDTRLTNKITTVQNEIENASVSHTGTKYNNLKERLDKEHQEVSAQLAQTEDKLNVENWELTSKGRGKKGITVPTSDDGRIEEYTEALPIFEEVGVPQTIYLVSTWLNEPGMLSTEQALELQNKYNWEIGSHSRTHPRDPVMKDITDDAFVEREFWESKRDLIAMGFDVQSYAYPGGNYGKRERMLAKKYYRSARCSDISFTRGVNYTPLNTYELKTIWLDPSVAPFRNWLSQHDRATAIQMFLDYAKEAIDRAHNNDGILFISTHWRNINTEDLKELYRQVLLYAKSKTEVTTVREALNQMGNIVEIGDYSQIGHSAPTDNHFIVGADGLASGTATFAERNRFTPSTPFDAFPFGLTVNAINSGHEGAPNGLAGNLFNYKTEQTQLGFNYQQFRPFGINRTYTRFVNEDKSFGPWLEEYHPLQLPGWNTFDHTTNYTDFLIGVTYSVVQGDNPNIATAPLGKNGLLKTFRAAGGLDLTGYSYQEYRFFTRRGVAGTTVRRGVNSDGSFGHWILESPLMPDENDFDVTTPLSNFLVGETISIVRGDNPNVSLAPEGKNGTLFTRKLTSADTPGYSSQIYELFDGTGVYRRRAQSATEWGNWIKISV